ncbi:MAG: response regulator transcription factor [Chitinophagaceae bacterium]|nr:response regulator transcription factor [Anaerolineae bacterium]
MNTNISPYRILIVDDVPSVREGLRWLLDNETGMVVVGEASDGLEAIEIGLKLEPDLIILDIELPRLDGFKVAEVLKKSPHPPLVIFLSVHDTPYFRQHSREIGGDGFITKSAGWNVLIEQLRILLSARH